VCSSTRPPVRRRARDGDVGVRRGAVAIIDRLVAEQRDPAPGQAPRSSTSCSVARRTYRRPGRCSVACARAVSTRAATRTSTLLGDALSVAPRRTPSRHRVAARGGGIACPTVGSRRSVRMLVGRVSSSGRSRSSAWWSGRLGRHGRAPGRRRAGALLHALAAKGRVEEVLALAARARSGGEAMPGHLRNAVLGAQIAAGDLDAAWAQAEAMWADACLPTGANLEQLLDLTLAAGNVVRAAGVLDLLLVIGVPVSSQRSGAVLRAEMAADGLDTGAPRRRVDPRTGLRVRPGRRARPRRATRARTAARRGEGMAAALPERGNAHAGPQLRHRCSRRSQRRSASRMRSRSSRRWSPIGSARAGRSRATRQRTGEGGRPRGRRASADRRFERRACTRTRRRCAS
jgi:hypothetical protein